jgi:two-component system sensor histidine kinase KdpD
VNWQNAVGILKPGLSGAGSVMATRARGQTGGHWRGVAASLVVPPAVAAVLSVLSRHLNLSSQVLIFLVAVVAVARLGGMVPALVAAVWASLLLNFYVIPPVHTFRIGTANDLIALLAFLVVALTVASVVELSGKQSRRAAQAAAEAAQLEAADKMRTALLTAVSHDLRTPLSAARAVVDTLRDPQFDLPPADRAELLEAADESLGRLTRLVENLLDMSRIQAGALRLRLEPVAVDEVLPRAIDDVPGAVGRVRLEATTAATAATAAPPVLADGALLERVLANLVGNAVKHTTSPIKVTVSPARAAPNGGAGQKVEIRVVDSGPGIPPEAWSMVFRPFQRLGDRDNTAGVGLGLALARGLTEAMNGTLTPAVTPGGGLTMIIELPAADVGRNVRMEADVDEDLGVGVELDERKGAADRVGPAGQEPAR